MSRLKYLYNYFCCMRVSLLIVKINKLFKFLKSERNYKNKYVGHVMLFYPIFVLGKLPT